MLTLEDLVIAQGDFRLGADFSVPRGARVAVVGPSGAGKSTLLGAIAGYLRTSGRVLWQGEDLGARAPAQRPVAMVFQDNNLFPHMTAAQNVGLGITPSLRLKDEDAARVTSALARVGLAGMGARKPAALSGGQQSRVAIARLLVQVKPLILLDEPFAALGPALRHEMLDLVGDVAADLGATVLMVTHTIGDAERFAEQLVWVENGVAQAPAATRALLADPPQGLRDYIGAST
ncbi:Thiamine import ATP-binding protein ThiQ [Aquimixticola soesokkakensis]|uniref:Thiamine import ATP-binding protein ThiQ n=1 Tax=Aquimixticola soesokkakensis TaxID=1519096 RepID=A0A1Y5RAC1_9RHOB|nr:ATP-binding cassette domain-containing protein [Aquimixticola soesokkakensis]SLN09995.1 Thiamine import ATP-binding protein ThiQ [Aquimixticola soesokkakensis]